MSRTLMKLTALLTLSAIVLLTPAVAGAQISHYGACGQGDGVVRPDYDAAEQCGVADTEHVALNTNIFAGEGLMATGHDIEASRPFQLAAATQDPVKAYYVCEAGLGLLDKGSESNPCRPVAGVEVAPLPASPCGGDAVLIEQHRPGVCIS